ncbi:GvpL/GvpF family gas vesicle protein [Chloroflexales bacterium ZM16-3]|nr:GvpL/GvpF family gas vesicle protein [Chloroflexales bacterium ZM16-3]
MLYLYAIIDRPGTGPMPGVGLADQPISYIYEGGIGAVVSQIDPQSIATGAVQIVRHELVVQSLAESYGVLPVRFGTILADVDAVRDLLRKRRDAFADDLSRVSGRVEMRLRVFWADDPHVSPVIEGAPQTGRASIERRIAEERAAAFRRLRATQISDELHSQLDKHAIASACKVLPNEQMLLIAAYLVACSAVACFQSHVAKISAERSNLRLLCTGPWPAYHFVSPA